MIGKIPKELKNLYHRADWTAKLYLELRWRVCPCEEIEKYVPKKGKILDLGSGYGILANFLVLKSEEREVIGIDLSSKRINVAKLSLGNRKNIEFFNQDIKDVALKFCDGVVMTDFLHHIPPAVSQDLFKFIYKKLSPGGKLVIEEVDNVPRWKFFFSFFIDVILNIGEPLYNRPALEWKKILEDFGFRVKIVPAHQGFFLSPVLLICSKDENNRNT